VPDLLADPRQTSSRPHRDHTSSAFSGTYGRDNPDVLAQPGGFGFVIVSAVFFRYKRWL
jgi:hypothetical protein